MLFPFADFDASLVAPLTPAEFIQRVLLPEAAVSLIMSDRNLGREDAIGTLRDSSRYGVAMFPSLDKGGADEKLVMERAMTRRKEIDAEEKLARKGVAVEESNQVEEGAPKTRQTRRRKIKTTGNGNEDALDIEGSTAESDTSIASRAKTQGTRRTRRKKPPPNSDVETSKAGSSLNASKSRKVSRPPWERDDEKEGPPAPPAPSLSSVSIFALASCETEKTPRPKRKPRPAYLVEPTVNHVSDSEADVETDGTPKPTAIPVVRAKGLGMVRGALDDRVKSAAVTAISRPLDMAKKKNASASGSSLERLSLKDSDAWCNDFRAHDSSDDAMEISQEETASQSKKTASGSKTRGAKVKSSSAWLLSSQES